MAQPSSEHATSTTSNLGDFDKLPAEIRNEIYKYALTAPSVVTVGRREDRPKGSRRRMKVLKLCSAVLMTKGKRKRVVACAKATGLGLLQVSSTIHAEAAALFYHANSFLFSHPRALSEFVDQIHEMAFFLVDIEVRGVGSCHRALFSQSLRDYRICSEPRRITFLVPPTSSATALGNARTTWTLIRSFVKRDEDGTYLSTELAALRAHMHTGFDGTFPVYKYGSLTEVAQLKRLVAFCFQVPRGLLFAGSRPGRFVSLGNQAKRERSFKDLVVRCWREDLFEGQVTEFGEGEQGCEERICAGERR